MEKVLILGGTQFFGKKLVERLIEEGKQVTIATRGMTQDSFGNSVERLILDRENKSTVCHALKDKRWDVVYDQTCYSPFEALEAAEALRGKVQRYIFTSTMAVYEFGIQHKEDAFQAGQFDFNFKTRREYPGFEGYQEAKRAAEKVLTEEKEFEVVSVRFPIVIGKDDYTNRLKFHVDKVVNNEQIGIDNLENRYSFITSVDAAETLLSLGKNRFVGSLNVGCSEDISLGELMNKIEELTGKKARIVEDLNNQNASPYSLGGSWSIDTQRAVDLGLSFAPLHDTLEELIKEYSSQKAEI